ncbi:hypothetical protein BDW59DRAFT_36348 [Aspergillus cavernicola]|uniref:histidine kinase n=1 Tax=Aspergillus cavernicola TaxID=176166 RepID=A0ABR4HBX4_9EURO
MTSDEQTKARSTFNLAKEREFYRYLPRDHATYPFAPFDETSQKTFVPIPSRDHALTSFARLGAMRLGAQRSIISLFGPTHQYILAEATAWPGPDGKDDLRLGCCILPKENGVCTDVGNLPLSQPSDDPAIVGGSVLVLSDPEKSEQHFGKYLLAMSLFGAQFYAGVPIIGRRGNTIGSYCVLDAEPRPSGIGEHEINFMKEMAATILAHLDMMQSRLQNSRAKKMIIGLGSFVEGKNTLRDSWLEAHEQYSRRSQSGETVEGQLNKQQQDLQEAKDHPLSQPLPYRLSRNDSSVDDDNKNNAPDTGRNETKKITFRSSASDDKMPDESVPHAFQKIFSRAANLIRESIEVEGVAFLDARIESFGGLIGYEARGGRAGREARAGDETASSDGSTDSTPTEDDTTTCRTLGSSTSYSSTINNDSRFEPTSGQEYAVRESVLKTILNRYPHGKIFNYNANGALSDDSSSGRGSSSSGTEVLGLTRTKRRRKNSLTRDAADLNRVLGGARSIIFLPLWDSHKSRWLAGVLVWTNTPQRVFTAEDELTFLRAFGNSVTAEVHQLDVEMAEKAKANLVSSISHELRSPLHGVLGTADILSDTSMNALQQGMVHTIESCGRTLLDTINHLLDFTYIDKFKKDHKSKHRHGRHAKQLKARENLERASLERESPGRSENGYAAVQLDAVLEEVVESIFAGHSFYHHPRAQPRHMSGAGSPKTVFAPSKQVTIIFDIHEAPGWAFYTQAGCWRRILLNLFSNALKYTHQGFIYLGLSMTKIPRRGSRDSADSLDHNGRYEVTLTVRDTGQGIGAEFLRNSLFTPFSQEDALAPGSGLGLSIVRKALRSIRGSIEVTSEKGRGTEISIQVPMSPVPAPDSPDGSSSTVSYSLIRDQTQGKTIGLVGFGLPLASERDSTLYDSLRRLCEDWFHLTVKMVSLQGDTAPPCDFYLMVHIDLDGPDAAGNQMLNVGEPIKISPLIVISQSPEVAHNMFARLTAGSQESIIEFISQPCGPHKLAKTLELCIQRLEGRGSNQAAETRWVEIPKSSQLALDLGPRDEPRERMRISKRPIAETIGRKHRDNLNNSSDSGPSLETDAEKRPAVLLVEDNHLNLQILIAYVKKEGWKCATAKNGLEAVEKFQADPGKYVMVIIDISMPVMNGFEASQNIRRFERKYFEANPDAKPSWFPTTIVALTGLDSAAAQSEAFASGIDTFLTKPVSRQNIQSLLRKCDV